MQVVETFTSIQGEGLHSGRPALFLRLAGCNLNCTWCDTPNRMHGLPMSLDSLRSAVLGAGVPLVVVTGGEPLLQSAELLALVREPGLDTVEWHLETNGTLFPSLELLTRFSHVVVSPKLGTSGRQPMDPLRSMDQWIAHAEKLIRMGREETLCFKFVVGSDEDVRDLRVLIDKIPARVPIVFQPEDGGVTAPPAILAKQAENMMRVLPLVLFLAPTCNVRVLPRIHRLLYGNQQGV